MYTRYPNYRFGGKVKLPENYSGNAFSSDVSEKDTVEPLTEDTEIVSAEGAEEVQSSAPPPKEDAEVSLIKQTGKRIKLPSFGFNLDRFFSGGFGFEELLLIALILLISQGDSDDEMILLLVLLLFVG